MLNQQSEIYSFSHRVFAECRASRFLPAIIQTKFIVSAGLIVAVDDLCPSVPHHWELLLTSK